MSHPTRDTELRRSRGILALALVLVDCGCSSPRMPSAPKPSESSSPGPSAAAAPHASLTTPPPPPPPEQLPDSCATTTPRGLAPLAQLETIAQACARGMQPLAPTPRVATLETGAALALPFTITDPSRCFRAAAAGAASIQELSLEIVLGDDRVLGADRLPGALALANLDGPICAPSAGEYRAVARALQGRGDVALQVWQAE